MLNEFLLFIQGLILLLVHMSIAILIEVGIMLIITWGIHFALIPFGINTKEW